MARVWIVAVRAVAVNRHIGFLPRRQHQQLMRTRRESVELALDGKGLGIEKQHAIALLIDRQ